MWSALCVVWSCNAFHTTAVVGAKITLHYTTSCRLHCRYHQAASIGHADDVNGITFDSLQFKFPSAQKRMLGDSSPHPTTLTLLPLTLTLQPLPSFSHAPLCLFCAHSV